MHVLVLTQYFPPENAYLVADLVKGLGEAGHQVRVLTGFPNYPEGKLYPGFRQKWHHRDQFGEAEVLRVPLFIDHSNSATRRMLNYISFGLSAATARFWAKEADVIYVYATQMTPAIGPWLWRLTGGAPYVLHIQDLWPDSIAESSLLGPGQRAVARRVIAPWLRRVYRRAEAVIGIAPTMVQALIDRGADQATAHLVYNWANDQPPVPATTFSGGTAGKGATRVVYAGNVGDFQDLETAVLAAHEARDYGVWLRIVGDGVALPRVQALVEELGCANVEFSERVPNDQMVTVFEQADFALVSLKDLPLFRGTIPSKFQAALAHGVPVISTVPGDLRDLVTELDVGLTAEPGDVASLATALREAAGIGTARLHELGANAAKAHQSHFSKTAGIDAIESILLSCRRPGPK